MRTIVILVLLVHGIGHSMCLLAGTRVADSVEGWNLRSWLLTDRIGETATRWIGSALWAAAMIGFLVTALALLDVLVPQDAWRALAVVSAAISLVAMVLFLNAFAALFNQLGALAVNVITLVGLLVADWPSDADLGI